MAEKGNALEKKLAKHHGGYISRSKVLRQKISEVADFLARTRVDEQVKRVALGAEQVAVTERLERLRAEVGLVSRLEREAQETYRERKMELDDLRV